MSYSTLADAMKSIKVKNFISQILESKENIRPQMNIMQFHAVETKRAHYLVSEFTNGGFGCPIKIL